MSVTKSWIRLLWRLRCSLQEGKISGRAAGRKASEEREVRRGDLMDGKEQMLRDGTGTGNGLASGGLSDWPDEAWLRSSSWATEARMKESLRGEPVSRGR